MKSTCYFSTHFLLLLLVCCPGTCNEYWWYVLHVQIHTNYKFQNKQTFHHVYLLGLFFCIAFSFVVFILQSALDLIPLFCLNTGAKNQVTNRINYIGTTFFWCVFAWAVNILQAIAVVGKTKPTQKYMSHRKTPIDGVKAKRIHLNYRDWLREKTQYIHNNH